MRQVFFLLITISVLASCSESENLTVEKELQNLSDPAQFFTLLNDKIFIIEAKNGTKINIEVNTFEFNNGELPEEPVQIEVKEVYDKSDMILNGIGTTSEGRLLESFGMIYIKASSGGKELKVKAGKSITISIPNKNGGYNGELFYGEQTDSLLNWHYAGTTKDTTEVIETIMPMSNNRASVKRTTYKYINGSRELVSDTIFTMKYVEYAYGIDSAISAPQEAYEFQIKNMGWINCDRFIEIEEKIDLRIELKKHNHPFGYIIFNSINSVMPILFNQKGEAIVRNLPKEYNIDVVVIDKINGNFMWVKKPLKTRSDSKLTLGTSKVSKENLKIALENLDK